MVKEQNNDSIIEHGDLFFFHRSKIDSEEVKELEDVGRFCMVTTPVQNQKTSAKSHLYRLFLLGQKHLPEIVEGKSTSRERNWALNVLTTSNPEDICQELMSAEYSMETRGKRRTKAATSAGEEKYSIVKLDNHTELAYILELPEISGPTQREFEIKKPAT